MTKHIITFPCTAQDLETALHAVCDHDGLWDAKVCADDVLVPIVNSYEHATRLVIETETKGETA